jgi:hypothetical protein
MTYMPSVFSPIVSGSIIETRYAASTSAVLLMSSSQGERRNATVYNHGAASLYISTLPTVQSNSFWVKITSGSYFEFPKPVYDGPVYGVWDAANGFAMVTDHRNRE